ncbi:MAG TPA: DUF4245 domain-containing protein [Blastococcus sp.]|nr:DUF4245 domain-containing protein [Blastococcus sp.]
MTDVGPTSQRSPHAQDGSGSGDDGTAPASPTMQRLARFNVANMVRSLLPLVVLCLVIVGWTALRQGPDERVQTVDPSTTVHLAAARASYPVQAPSGLAKGYLPTSARTNAGNVTKGAPVTLEIGYLTPEKQFAGFTESDDPGAQPVHDVLDGATPHGTADIGGAQWTRSTTERGETALSRTVGRVTLVVTGSASAEELTAVAASVRPYSG